MTKLTKFVHSNSIEISIFSFGVINKMTMTRRVIAKKKKIDKCSQSFLSTLLKKVPPVVLRLSSEIILNSELKFLDGFVCGPNAMLPMPVLES